MEQAVHDWKVVVGWDASQVVKGNKRLEAMMSRLNKVQSVSNRAEAISGSRTEASARKVQRLEQKRTQAQEALLRLKKHGVDDKEFTALQNRLNASKTILGYDKVILATRAKILEAKKREFHQDKAAAAERARAKADAMAMGLNTVKGWRDLTPKKKPEPKQKEEKLEFSRIVIPGGEDIRRRQIDLQRLQERARNAFSKVPDTPAFAVHRQEIAALILKIQDLSRAYQTAGTTQALKRLDNDLKQLRNTTSTYTQMANKAVQGFNAQQFAAEKLRNSLHNLAAGYFSVFAAIEGGRRFLATGMEFETFDAQMLGVSGTLEQAGKDFDFVSRQSLLLGTNLKESTRSFAKFGTAATLSNMDPDKVREMFVQISKVNRAFQLAPERQGYAFLALEQMLNKGVVSMEELRRQLGEQWGGALPQAAEAMGMTNAELIEMIENGKLVSKDFLPKFLAHMENYVTKTGMLAASLKTVNAEQNRLVSLMQLAVKEGFMAGQGNFIGAFQDLSMILRDNIGTIRAFGSALSIVIRSVTVVLRTISPVIAIVGNAFDQMREAMERAMDVSKDWKDLTVIEGAFRSLGIVVGTVNLLVLYLAKWLEDISKWFGVSEKDAQGFTKQMSSLAIVLLTSLGAFKLFRGAILLLLSPLRMVWNLASSLFGLLGGRALISRVTALSTAARAGATVASTSAATAGAGAIAGSIVSSGVVAAAAPAVGFGMLSPVIGEHLLTPLLDFFSRIASGTDRTFMEDIRERRVGFQYRMQEMQAPAKQTTVQNTFHIQANDTDGVVREIVQKLNQQALETSMEPPP